MLDQLTAELVKESQETVWTAPGVSGAHRVGACQSPGPQVIMNELGKEWIAVL